MPRPLSSPSFPPCAFCSFSVKSGKGTLAGVKAGGNLREPFGLILRAVDRSPLFGGRIQSRLSAGAWHVPTGEQHMQLGSCQSKASVSCVARLRKPVLTAGWLSGHAPNLFF